MNDVSIEVLRIADYADLCEQYELPMENACSMEVGFSWISHEAQKPEGFCESAWMNLQPFVLALAAGGRRIFNDWMKDPYSCIISCNDGLRPVSFLLKTDPDPCKE